MMTNAFVDFNMIVKISLSDEECRSAKVALQKQSYQIVIPSFLIPSRNSRRCPRYGL